MESTLEPIFAVLTTTPARWQALAAALSPDVLNRPPRPGEWAALDCLRHIVDIEREVFPVRVRCFLAGQDFPAFNPDVQGTKPDPNQSPAALAAEFTQLRQRNLALLGTLTEADFARTARHGELGPVTLGEMLHEWAGHDLMHTVQAERALMQPFIAASGPWVKYFTDHLV